MKKTLITLILIALSVIAVVYYIMNKPHKDINNETTINITAVQLFNEFTTNESAANAKYLNKALEVNGIIIVVAENQDNEQYIVLKTNDEMYGIMCTLRHKNINSFVGDNVNIKGYCSGFAGDVKLTDCVLTNK
ncbi:MAG TPA: hypothetical protein VLZ83_04535 [Edaphocola sp.]|nr:hypothetical protein [Edaphocola sp.]